MKRYTFRVLKTGKDIRSKPLLDEIQVRVGNFKENGPFTLPGRCGSTHTVYQDMRGTQILASPLISSSVAFSFTGCQMQPSRPSDDVIKA